MTKIKGFIYSLKVLFIKSSISDKVGLFVFLISSIVSIELILRFSWLLQRFSWFWRYKYEYILLGIIMLTAFAHGWLIFKVSKHWKKISSLYVDDYISWAAIVFVIYEHGIFVNIIVLFFIPIFLFIYTLYFPYAYSEGTATYLAVFPAFVVLFSYYFLMDKRNWRSERFISLIITFAITYGFLRLFIYSKIFYYVSFLLFIFITMVVLRFINIVQAYRKALKIRSLAKHRSSYSLEEFNSRVAEILFQTEMELPDYWEEIFKLKEMQKLVEGMKIENQEKEIVLLVLKSNLNKTAERRTVVDGE